MGVGATLGEKVKEPDHPVSDIVRRDAEVGQTAKVVSTRRAYLLLAAMILLWGANWPVIKVGVTLMPPLWFAFARILLGGLSFAVLAAFKGWLRPPPRHDLPIVFSLGLLQMGLFLLLITVAVQFVPAGRSALLAYTHPLWVAPGAAILLRERVGVLKLVGLILGAVGLLALFNPFAFPWHDAKAVFGNGLLLFAALLWAIGLLHARRHRWIESPIALAPWQMLVAAPPVLLMALLLENPTQIQWSPKLGLILFYNGPIATAFCYWASVTVTRALPALTTSIGFLGVPVMGILFSSLLLGETPTWSLAAGLFCILAGLGLVNMADLRRSRSTAEQ
jgi:drug/metabolite transporter (DMT)-like permease